MMEFEPTVLDNPAVWDESRADGCSKTELGWAGPVEVDSFDKSINGKWTERVSVGDFNGVGATDAVDWEAFPLSSKIPLSDT